MSQQEEALIARVIQMRIPQLAEQQATVCARAILRLQSGLIEYVGELSEVPEQARWECFFTLVVAEWLALAQREVVPPALQETAQEVARAMVEWEGSVAAALTAQSRRSPSDEGKPS